MNSIKRLTVISGILLFAGCDINKDMKSLSGNKDVVKARTLAADNGCLSCHAVANMIVGPGWKRVSQFYADNPDAKNILINKIKIGGKGTWNHETGGETMPGFEEQMSDEEISIIVDYILSLTTEPNIEKPTKSTL